jgi:hypothetical protein
LSSTPTIPNLGTLTYQWKRAGDNISGATSSTYNLVQDDITKTITVTVSAANCLGEVTSPATAVVTKASQTAPAAPTMASNTATSITLNVITGCEYNIDGGAYQSSPLFEGLTPSTSYTFTQRLTETATHFASEPSPAATFTTEPLGIVENMPSKIRVYPNPTTGELQVTSDELQVTNPEYSIFNGMGQRVLHGKLHGELHGRGVARNAPTIDVSALPVGLYYLKISGEVVKFVKQ